MPDIFIGEKTDEKTEEPKAERPSHDHDAIRSVEEMLHKKQQSLGQFSSYCIRPKGITFANQEPDEIILLFLRRHFFTNIPWILTALFLIALPLFFFALSFFINFAIFPLPTNVVAVLTAFYYLTIFGYVLSNFLSWFYNIGMVTQKRIIDLDSSSILSHNIATSAINELIEVKFTQGGFFQSLFHYGDIHIQTEAVHANFEFIAAPNPTEATDIISDLRVANKSKKYGVS